MFELVFTYIIYSCTSVIIYICGSFALVFTHYTLKTVPLGNVCVLVQHALRPVFFGEILQQNQEQR